MLKIYNTLTRKIEEFVPLDGKKVGFYSCGPTVYNYVHIGNLSAYLFVDLLKRYLKYRGFAVLHVMNITDVDDKTIRDSQKEGKSLRDFTEFYTDEFFKDMQALNMLPSDILAKATEHIPEMVALVQKLMEKEFAYESNGSIYFKISAFSDYGRLANLEAQDLKQNADGRLNVKDEYDKENANDFVLWKAWDESDGDVFWETAIGKGRPGWHIECSAMSMKYLGETLDLHVGGVDLVFPHHTNEIAQSEAATGKPFSKYWMHNAHLMVEGKKMSKSLGNFFTLRDLLAKGAKPMLVRIEFLKSHYRAQANFSFAGMEEDKTIASKFINLLIDLDSVQDGKPNDLDIEKMISEAREKFILAMDDDLNISLAFSGLFEFINSVNKQIKTLSQEQAGEVKKFILEIDSVLGFVEILYSEYQSKVKEISVDSEVVKLLEDRATFRSEKKFAESDAIRDELLAKGIMVNDTAEGYKIRLKEVV